jgi:hypothetical protein
VASALGGEVDMQSDLRRRPDGAAQPPQLASLVGEQGLIRLVTAQEIGVEQTPTRSVVDYASE